MTNEAAEARKAYMKAWRARNKDKVKAINARYWQKKASLAKENETMTKEKKEAE